MARKVGEGKQRTLRVLAAILYQDGRLLIAKRKKGDRFEGLWEFPGGKIEPEEKPEDCLVRELREEFGVKARAGRFLGSIHHVSASLSIELLAYAVAHVAGVFHLYDHDEIRWVTPEECRDYALTEPDRILLEQITASGTLQENL
jgi:8-oxo-dGTP diphosphatase